MLRSSFHRRCTVAALLVAAPLLISAAHTDPDPDTAAWWQLITVLSSDEMRGRDTGSPEHRRAAELVSARFAKAGLQPAGDDGSYLQRVPMHEVRVEKQGTRFELLASDGRTTPLRFLHQIAVRPTAALPATLLAPVVFRGYCGAAEVGPDVAGKVVLCFGGRRRGMPGAGERLEAVRARGGVGLIAIDDIGFTVEPPRWPMAYARAIDLPDAPAPAAPALPVMRLSAEALAPFLAGTERSPSALLNDAVAARPLAPLDLAVQLRAAFAVTAHTLASDNVLALLPGTDPGLAPEVIVLDAHLDGYGIGEAVDGDSIYNGAFDDAAYVATLVRLAEQRQGRGYARSVLFAAFTGEEKGLLGSRWFLAHPTVPRAALTSVITLDAIRPLFPLRAVTLIGREASSLRDHVETVAAPMRVEVRPDLEPERGMITRTDASPFLRAGIPAVAFMFAYDARSVEEAKFREWYRVRYHTPKDDVTQPIDMQAATDFNNFVYRLVDQVAMTPTRPVMTPPTR